MEGNRPMKLAFRTDGLATPLPVPVAANDNFPKFVDASLWEGRPVPERAWYIPGMVPSRTVTLLSGDGGLGKSLLAIQLAVASCLNAETIGIRPEHCRVVYVGAEDEVDEFHRRMHSVLGAFGKSFDDLEGRFVLLPLAESDATLSAPDKAGRMVPTPLMGYLIEKIVAFEPGLVVLDTSADLFGGDEIKRAQVRQFVADLRKIAIRVNCAILLLSHPSVAGMQSGSGTSGSTAWNNSVRSRLYLTAATGDGADPDARVLTTMKANYGPKGDAISMQWRTGAFAVMDPSKPSPAAGILNKRADTIFLALLSSFNRQGTNVGPNRSSAYAPTVMARHPDSAGINKRALELAMHRLLDVGMVQTVTEGPPSKRRQRLVVSSENFSPSSSELPTGPPTDC